MDPLHTTPAGTTRLPNWLTRRAADMPAHAALIMGDRTWSYADLDRLARDLAGWLATKGVTPGQRVSTLLRNGPHVAVLIHALIRCGAILVPLNLRLSAAEIAWQLAHAAPILLLYEESTEALAATASSELPDLRRAIIGTDPDELCPTLAAQRPGTEVAERDQHVAAATTVSGRNDGPATHDSDTIDLGAIHCMIYTSGTTGRPKGVLLSYGNHWWGAIGSALNLGLRADDRWLVCLPLFHIGGLSILLRSAIYGTTALFPDPAASSFDPSLINRTIAQGRATIISVVAAQLARMLDDLAAQGAGSTASRAYPEHLRCVLLGGGPAPRPLLESCAGLRLPVTQSYGLTEGCSQVATLAPADALRKLGSVGRPLISSEIRIAELEDVSPQRHRNTEKEQEPQSPVVGEILVRGQTISPGYVPSDAGWGTVRPAVDAEGWLHTGDVGYLDGEGYLYVLDRRTDLIISGGENVYPAEVEATLLAHPSVAEAGVYGEPDERWGQRVVATVVRRPGMVVDEAELLAFCRERLARYKAPAQIRFVESLPRNASGKLLRRELRAETSS